MAAREAKDRIRRGRNGYGRGRGQGQGPGQKEGRRELMAMRCDDGSRGTYFVRPRRANKVR